MTKFLLGGVTVTSARISPYFVILLLKSCRKVNIIDYSFYSCLNHYSVVLSSRNNVCFLSDCLLSICHILVLLAEVELIDVIVNRKLIVNTMLRENSSLVIRISCTVVIGHRCSTENID